MALSNALFSAVSGLQIHQTMLDVIGNNIANTNTVGYKSQTVQFQDLLYQNLRTGSVSANGGGVNPEQIGFGALVGSINSNFLTGTLEPTGRNLDLAIQGSGFFVVNNGQSDLFTRAGRFDLDQQGFVVDSATGFRLQRTGTVGEGTATTPPFQVSGDNDIHIPLGAGISGQPTGTVTLRGNLSASLGTGETFTTAIQIFDTQGTEHPLSLTFTKTATNTFSLDASVAGGTVTGTPVTGITFNANGTLQSPATASINLSFPPGLPGTQAVTLQLGTAGQADGLAQFGGASTAAAISQDGSAAGTLVSFSVDVTGTFQGVFSNGVNLPLAQLALARFANQGGLNREGQNLFSQTVSSGPALIGTPQSGELGAIQGGALEGSNVNVSTEFTRLIIAQRGFQVNARTVSVSNDLLQELANLIR
jgi:flagellar hook protein FlgE